MEAKLLFAFASLVLIILISGCTQAQNMKKDIENFETPFISENENPLESPTTLCINLCNEKKDAKVDLSNGPCLSDKIAEKWVCDVSHDPRQDLDNAVENQCPAFNNGTAKHFVEVDENCDLLRTH